MTPLSYQARTETPDGADIDRIVNGVIAEAAYAQQQCHPDDVLPQSLIAKNMAREIKRRLCQLISVEVDLVISGSTAEDEMPAPVALAPGGCIDYLSTGHKTKERAIKSHIVYDEISDWDLTMEACSELLSTMTPPPAHYSRGWWQPGIQLASPLNIFRGSLPGPI